jgi:N-acyl-L-homoserine lactone synthetase
MRVVSGVGAGLPEGYYGRVAHYRHRVFVERLGWQLDTQDGAEVDQFDRPDTVYVAIEDEQGDIAGCARLLPTTRPYLLSEVFPQLLNGLPPPNDPTIWELSRFAAMDFNSRSNVPLAQFSSSATAALMRGAMSTAASLGARRLLTVSPVGIERLIRRLGITAHRAGPPMIVSGHAIFACWIEI